MPWWQERSKPCKQNKQSASRWPHDEGCPAGCLSLLFPAKPRRSEKRYQIKIFGNRTIPKTDVDWAHWKATSEDDSLSERCPFCPCLSQYLTYRALDSSRVPDRCDRNRLFHCRRSDYGNEAGVGSLCLFCQHLDPGHLFGRFRQGNGLQGGFVKIVLGTLAELEARKECAFCHIVICTIWANHAVYGTKEEPIPGDHPITLSVEPNHKSSFGLSFDEGPEIFMAMKKVLPTNPKSIPEVDQIVGTSISWKRIRQWIDLCRSKHKKCLPANTAPSGMRLIDVRDKKVTPELHPRDRHAFIALSYVWGKNIDSRKCVLLKENTARLEKTNGLENLPKTIEDAMMICENLGQRFLWVDRLCIVQDDDATKGHQIHAMADIFQSAVLTIVAACGDSMESPIPGISTDRKVFQSQTRIADLQGTSGLPRLSRILHGASWSQRGWTYQESILSSRKLYFTEVEVWFTCSDGFQREDVSLEGSSRRGILRQDISMTQLHTPEKCLVLEDYWRHLEGYTKRSLTYQSDIYNAFTGILTALFREDNTVYGLPKLYFDQALLWRLAEDTSTCGIRDCTVVKQQLSCPSWSWSSINGPVMDGETYQFGEYTVSLVLWLIVDEYGNAKTINVEFGKGSYFRISLAFAWRGGCFESPFPSDLRKKLELDPEPLRKWVENDLFKRWPTRKDFWNEVRSQGGPDTQLPLTTSNHLRPGMLLTRTQTAVLGLGKCRKKSRKFEYFEVLNRHGDMVGAVEANELCLKSKSNRDQRPETATYELMALSLSDPPFAFMYDGKNEFRFWTNQLVKVFLISWNKNASVARRVSIGWVYLKVWLEIERTWKTVVLA